MKRVLLALVCVTFIAVAASGCCKGKCPFQKKDVPPNASVEHPEHPAN